MTSNVQAYRASLLHFCNDPAFDEHATLWHTDGLLVIADGKVVAADDYDKLLSTLPAGTTVHDWRGKIITPGFIDTHVHYPQTDIIGSPASGLLPWLNTYTFPTEGRFDDEAHATEVADFFLAELLRNGTTTAAVYCTVHPQSVNAFFGRSHALNLRMIAGKVMMDRNAPEFLLDTPESSARDSETLINRWHNKGRQHYAITPRFAPTSSDAQLKLAGELASQYPDTYIQTHVAENTDEVKWVKELFPDSRSYLDVYDRSRTNGGHTLGGDGLPYFQFIPW
jgi:guanine deaminase